MENIENIIENQYELLTAMEKALTNFKKEPSARKTSSSIRRRLETLETYWEDF